MVALSDVDDALLADKPSTVGPAAALLATLPGLDAEYAGAGRLHLPFGTVVVGELPLRQIEVAVVQAFRDRQARLLAARRSTHAALAHGLRMVLTTS